MTLDEVAAIANKPTHARLRAEAMGWVFRPVEVRESGFGQTTLRCQFTCVCGTPETLMQIFSQDVLDAARPETLRLMLDMIGNLHRRGSFSRHHLLADGYTEAQIAEFERKGAEFDARHLNSRNTTQGTNHDPNQSNPVQGTRLVRSAACTGADPELRNKR